MPETIAFNSYEVTIGGVEYYIPERMMGGINRYINDGIKPGDFLCAVIDNDLRDSCGRADRENLVNLPAYVHFFSFAAPRGCHGSHKKRLLWQANGGLKGPTKTKEE